MEPLDLAAGLGVVRPGMLVADPKMRELGLEHGLPEKAAVVVRSGRWATPILQSASRLE